MKKLIENLLKEGTVIADGSWGTQLQELGLPVGECPDIWNITKPQLVEKVAKSYVEAGSKIILTNTFRSNKIALNDFGYGDKVKEINKAGVEISKRASEGKAFVFASVGPTGKMIMMGEATEEEMFEAFKEQIQTISEAGADGIIIETMSDLNEAKIALKAAKETALPVVVSMAFDSGKDKGFTMMGNSPEQTAKELTEAGADVIGANCGQGIEGFINICKKLKTSTNLPVWIKPNAGLPEFDGSKTVYKTSPVEFVKYIPDLLNSGADFIGGCCGTNPEFIKAVIRKINTGK
ncbi:MAG TPA: homocysteine S-methyltransferase family protein [Ignavibacteriaceae bacterium]